MKKRIQGLLTGLILGIALTTTVTAIAANFQAVTASFPILINGTEFKSDNPPVVIDGRTYLPLKAMGEALGVKVDWNSTLSRVEISKSNPAAPAPASTPTPTTAPTPTPSAKVESSKTEEFTFSTKPTSKYSDIFKWTQTVGEITNNTDKDYAYMTVSATYYSTDGTVLAKGSAYVSELKAGQTKSFETTATDGDYTGAAKIVFQVDYKN